MLKFSRWSSWSHFPSHHCKVTVSFPFTLASTWQISSRMTKETLGMSVRGKAVCGHTSCSRHRWSQRRAYTPSLLIAHCSPRSPPFQQVVNCEFKQFGLGSGCNPFNYFLCQQNWMWPHLWYNTLEICYFCQYFTVSSYVSRGEVGTLCTVITTNWCHLAF